MFVCSWVGNINSYLTSKLYLLCYSLGYEGSCIDFQSGSICDLKHFSNICIFMHGYLLVKLHLLSIQLLSHCMHTHVVFPLSDPDGQVFCFVLVIHKFEGVPEHVVLVKPHGNAKHSRQYIRMKESTKQKLKDQLKTTTSKLAVDHVYELKGGILKASSGGDLTRDLQQAYDLK